MIRLLSHPVKGHEPPALSNNLLEDLGLMQVLTPFFDDPAAYLTHDAGAITQRGRVVQAIRRQAAWLPAMETARDAIHALREAARVSDVDPVRVLAGLACIHRVYCALNELRHALANATQADAPEIVTLRHQLENMLAETFPPNMDEAWQALADGVDLIGGTAYRFHFDEDAQIKAVTLSRVRRKGAQDWQRRFNPFTKDKQGARYTLQPDNRSQPGYGYDPKRNLNTQQQLMLTFQRLLARQASAAQGLLRTASLRIGDMLAPLHDEFDFILRTDAFLCALEAKGGMLTYPCLLPSMEDSTHIAGLYHPALLLFGEEPVTQNDLYATRGRHVILLGGYNRDGKTTYLRAVGAVQVLFQMGLPVPAREAALYPVQRIASVFSKEEKTRFVHGKLGQELETLQAAFSTLAGDGLFLLNEPISGTSPGESLQLCREILCVLLAKGQRAVWVTHLFPLFDDVLYLQSFALGSDLLCMRTRQEDTRAAPYSVQLGVPAYDSGTTRA